MHAVLPHFLLGQAGQGRVKNWFRTKVTKVTDEMRTEPLLQPLQPGGERTMSHPAKTLLIQLALLQTTLFPVPPPPTVQLYQVLSLFDSDYTLTFLFSFTLAKCASSLSPGWEGAVRHFQDNLILFL